MSDLESEITEGKPQLTPIKVTVTDLDIGFGSMVGLLIKFALAAIPAAILLFIFGFIVAGFWTAILRQL